MVLVVSDLPFTHSVRMLFLVGPEKGTGREVVLSIWKHDYSTQVIIIWRWSHVVFLLVVLILLTLCFNALTFRDENRYGTIRYTVFIVKFFWFLLLSWTGSVAAGARSSVRPCPQTISFYFWSYCSLTDVVPRGWMFQTI